MVYMALSSKVSHFWHNGGIIWINTTRRSGTLGLDSFMNSGYTYRTEERKLKKQRENIKERKRKLIIITLGILIIIIIMIIILLLILLKLKLKKLLILILLIIILKEERHFKEEENYFTN